MPAEPDPASPVKYKILRPGEHPVLTVCLKQPGGTFLASIQEDPGIQVVADSQGEAEKLAIAEYRRRHLSARRIKPPLADPVEDRFFARLIRTRKRQREIDAETWIQRYGGRR